MRLVVLSGSLVTALMSVPFASEGTSAQPPEPKPAARITTGDAARFKKLMRHSVDFFEDHARDKESGSYLTNIEHDGTRKQDDGIRHIVASSRMLYALAHTSRIAEKYKDHALQLKSFILNKMTAEEDKVGPYFLIEVKDAGKEVKKPTQLQVHHQAYGLCGLVAMYSIDPTNTALEDIAARYTSFRTRFKHTKGTGFFDLYTLPVDGMPGTANDKKSFNSTVYVATAFLLELHDAVHRVQASKDFDAEHQALARKVYDTAAADLTELADAVADKMVDVDRTGFIVEQFDSQWVSDWRGFQLLEKEKQTIGIVGHNFQAAWFLLRASRMPTASKERTKNYSEKASIILRSMLVKTEAGEGMLRASPVDFVNGGFHDVFRRETGEPIFHTNKAWWQQAEGILALTLAEKLGVLTDRKALDARDKALQFFVKHFVDDEDDVAKDGKSNGEFKTVTREGESDTVTHEGKPNTKDVKGEAGKSAYHTVELYRYLIEYAGQR